MLFNSISFIIFLPIVFLLYWFIFPKTKTSQNSLLVLASFVFYMFWDWRFSLLLIFSILFNYYCAIFIESNESHKRRLFYLRFCVIINISVLGFFKYFNFFVSSINVLLSNIGLDIDTWTLNIILPIGISFYTFHGLSYILDVYYKRINTHRNIIDYTLFVSYFPLLVAGPIERATHLLPQLKVKRSFNYRQGVEGLELIIWGFFKKLVIADSLSPIVADIFGNAETYNPSALIIGALAFAFQVYGDFSGYTDIARGVSKLFGIELLLNFNFPYFSRTIPEFWSRWHISLSSWLNDYVFLPIALRFRQFEKNGVFIAVLSTFAISGLWHGAAWHFIAWGIYHGLLYLPYIYTGKGLRSIFGKKNENLSIADIPSVFLTFILVLFGYILFRADNLSVAWTYISNIFSNPLFEIPNFEGKIRLLITLFFVSVMLFSEGFSKNENNPLTYFVSKSKLKLLRWLIYSVLLVIIGMYMNNNVSSFIYFQF